MSPVLSRHFQPTQLRGVNRDQRTVDIVASDFSLDSYNTRIDPAGWDLEQFKKNPVICLQHDSYSRLPIAQALPETVRVENGKLVMTVKFPEQGASDDADESFSLIAAGVLRGVSVGFDPTESEDKSEQISDGNSITVRIFRKQRLMEVSFVTIPSNDNGLVVRARELNADEGEIRDITQRLEHRLQKHPESETTATGGDMQVLVRMTEWDKYVGYFLKKQPANRASTKVLEKFFKLRSETQPEDEVKAWERMAEILEEPQPEPKLQAVVEEQPVLTGDATPSTYAVVVDVKEEPTPPPAPTPEAPEPERKASVQISLSALTELPSKWARAYVETAVEALRQGMPIKDAVGLIDGLNETVTTSFSKP